MQPERSPVRFLKMVDHGASLAEETLGCTGMGVVEVVLSGFKGILYQVEAAVQIDFGLM